MNAPKHTVIAHMWMETEENLFICLWWAAVGTWLENYNWHSIWQKFLAQGPVSSSQSRLDIYVILQKIKIFRAQPSFPPLHDHIITVDFLSSPSVPDSFAWWPHGSFACATERLLVLDHPLSFLDPCPELQNLCFPEGDKPICYVTYPLWMLGPVGARAKIKIVW